jgi:ribonuclease H2 subunit A
MHMNTGSGYPGGKGNLMSVLLKDCPNLITNEADPGTKQWLEDHKHPVSGFPSLVRFSWGTCTPFFKGAVEVTWLVSNEPFRRCTSIFLEYCVAVIW